MTSARSVIPAPAVMSDQLSLEPEARPAGRGRVEALAGVLAGFAAPGYDSWTKVPKAVKERSLEVAADALRRMSADDEQQPRKV